MGACAILPRIIGHGRAAELLFTGRDMTSEEGLAWGFYNRVVEDVLAEAYALADELAKGPSIAHAITKRQLDAEWNMTHRPGARNGSAGPGAVHGNQRFQARLRGLREQAEAGVPGRIDAPTEASSRWPFFEPGTASLRSMLEDWCADNLTGR